MAALATKPQETDLSPQPGEAISSVLDHIPDDPHEKVRSAAAALNLGPTTT